MKDEVLSTLIEMEFQHLVGEEYVVIDPSLISERILDRRDVVQISDIYVRGWAFTFIRKSAYDLVHARRAVDNPRLSSQMTFPYAEFCPEFIVGERSGKRVLLLLDYEHVYLEDIEAVIAAENREIETKTLTVYAYQQWRDVGLKSGKLKRRPSHGPDSASSGWSGKLERVNRGTYVEPSLTKGAAPSICFGIPLLCSHLRCGNPNEILGSKARFAISPGPQRRTPLS